MPFDPLDIQLPVVEIIPQVRRQLSDHNSLIVHAPPGAGKSTLIPLTLMEEPWLQGKKILMLEPRRLAAKSIASRMSDLLGTRVGQEVGYRIRFENRSAPTTRVEVLTEGILTRMIHKDNSLEGVGLVIFDEFHERNLHADVAMALCREVQQILRPDLRIMVMSATLDMPQLSKLLDAPIVESKGKQYPVEIIHTQDISEWTLPEMVAQTIIKAFQEKTGDILAFLPGQREIKKCEEILRQKGFPWTICPLYGMLSPQKQQQAIMPHPQGKRKVVLATSIAETSLTIEGVSVVVDSGFGRISKFDPRSGLSRLETIAISKDSADQRAGRAGRLGPGTCYRLWSKATDDRLAAFRSPEILDADLSSLCLDLAQWGVEDIGKMTWLTPPPSGALAQAKDLLEQLGAVENNKLTPHGIKIRELPCHPRIAHMLLLAQEEGHLPLASDIAAILEERDPLPKEAGVDFTRRLETLRRHRAVNKQGKSFEKIAQIAANYRKLLDIPEENGPFDPYETGLILTYAYPERIAHARPGNNAQYMLTNGKLVAMNHQDALAHEPWLCVAHIDARDGMGKIFMASPLNPRDLAPMVKERKKIIWDTRHGGLLAQKEWRIGHIVLQTKALREVSQEEKISAITQAVQQEGERLLDLNEKVEQWQNRVNSLRLWREEEDWPDVSTPALLKDPEWLVPYLTNVEKIEDLKKLAISQLLQHHLPYDKQEALERLAPEKIQVPSGSWIRISYQSDGEKPILAVRLQEIFGLLETPTVNEGKKPMLIHLLSPGFKPVQVTTDLRSFWENTYFEVKKDLKRRYPKHYWPENPLGAEAVRGVKRRPE